MKTIRILAAAMAFGLASGCGGGEAEPAESGEAVSADNVARGEGMSITTEDGEVRLRRDDGATALPGGLPAYPGADRTGGYAATSQGPNSGSGQIATMMTGDAPERVIAFYRDAIEDSGRSIAAEMNMGDMQSISSTDADRRGGITVTAIRQPNGTQIMVTGGRQN